MKRKLASTLLLLIVVVEKSQGYGGSGSFSKSFSSSSASSSASSFSSSGSFSANGPLDLTGINSPLKNGLTGTSSFASSEAHADASGASATSGASSSSGAGAGHGALSGSGAISGSSSGAGILPGLIPGSLAGSGSGSLSGVLPNSELLPGAGSLAGSSSNSGSLSGSGFAGQAPFVQGSGLESPVGEGGGHGLDFPSGIPSEKLPHSIYSAPTGVGSSAGSNAVASAGSSSGAVLQTGLVSGSKPVQGGSFDLSSPTGAEASGGSLTNSGFGAQTGYSSAGDVNKYGTNFPPKVAEGSFILKKDHSHPPSTGTGGYFPSSNDYHSGSSALANSGSYSGSSQFGTPGIPANGLIPGPNGIILDFKPASPGGGNPGPSPSPPLIHVVQTPLVPIHSTNPTNTVTHTDAKDSGLSYNLITALPGSKGSIYDSKTASHLGTYFSEGKEGSYSSAGLHGSQIIPATNVPVHTPGHYGIHASLPGSTGSIHQGVLFIKPTITKEIITALPGRPGSILESKPVSAGVHGFQVIPATNVPVYTQGHAGAGDNNKYGTNFPPKVVEGSFIPKKDHSHSPSTGTGGYFPSGNGYHSSSSAQANSGSYSGSSQSGTPGNGLFPGPNGSIHDFKPAPPGGGNPPPPPSPPLVHVVQTPVVPTHSTIPTNTYTHTDAKESGLSYNLIIALPGSKGSIYDSKPASHLGTYFSEDKEGSYSSTGIHGSQNIPATNVPVYTQDHGIHASLPTIIGSLPGSTGSIHQSVPISKPTITKEIISTLPGRPGSIHDSKPVGGYTCTGGSCNVPLHPSSDCIGASCTNPSPNKHEGNIKVVIDAVSGVIKPVLPNTAGCSDGYCGVKPAPSNVQVCSGPFCKPVESSGNSYSGSTSGSYDQFSGPTVPVSGCSSSSCKDNGGTASSGYNSASSGFSHSDSSFNQQISNIGIDLSNPKVNCPGGYCDNKPRIPSTPGCTGTFCKPTNSYSGSHPGSSLIKPTSPSIDLVAPVVGYDNKPACSGSHCKNSPCSGPSCGTSDGSPTPSVVSYVEVPICIGSGCSKPSGNSYHKPSTYDNKPSCSGSYCGGKNTASSVSDSGSYSAGTYNQQTPTIEAVPSPIHTPGESTFNHKPSCSGPNCHDKNHLSKSGAASTSGSYFNAGIDGSQINIPETPDSTYNQKPSCSGTYCNGGKPSTSGDSHQGAGVVPVGVLVHPQQTSGNIDVRIKPTIPTTVHHKVDGNPQFIGESGGALGSSDKIQPIAGPGTGNLPIDQSQSVSYGNIDGASYVHPSSSSGPGINLGQHSDGFVTGNVVIQKSDGTEINKYNGVSSPDSGNIQPGPLCHGTTCDNNKSTGLAGANAGSSSNSLSGSNSGSFSGGNNGINIGYNSGIETGDDFGSNIGGSSYSGSQSGGYSGAAPGGYSGTGSGSNTASGNAGNTGGQFGANSGSYSSASSGSYSGGNSGSYSGGNSGSYSGGSSGSHSGGYSGSGAGGHGFNLGLGIGKGCASGNCEKPSVGGGLLGFGFNLGGSSAVSGSNSGTKGGSGSYSTAGSSSGSALTALTDLLHPIGLGGAFSKSGSLSGSGSFAKSGALSSGYSSSFASSGAAAY